MSDTHRRRQAIDNSTHQRTQRLISLQRASRGVSRPALSALTPGTLVWACIPHVSIPGRVKDRPAVILERHGTTCTVAPVTSVGTTMSNNAVLIKHWDTAKLSHPSAVAIRSLEIDRSQIQSVVGTLHPDDIHNVMLRIRPPASGKTVPA